MTTKPFTAVVLSSVIASVFVPLTATAQTEPAQATITATDAAVTTPAAAQEMATPAPEMQSVLDKLGELGAKPLHTLTVDQARAQSTPADAVAALTGR